MRVQPVYGWGAEIPRQNLGTSTKRIRRDSAALPMDRSEPPTPAESVNSALARPAR